MKKVYKYQLKLQAMQVLTIPVIALLSIQQQFGVWTLWAEVDTDRVPDRVKITVVGTGHEIPEDAGQYFSTIQDGSYVWHFYVKVG